MTDTFDKGYWESHWREGDGAADGRPVEPSPYLDDEVAALTPGTALDAGCGEGAEARWLAARGWQVTAVDISAEALERAAARSGDRSGDVTWVEADLRAWQPTTSFDLVTTFYAHPAMPQLAFYERIADWVAPGGTLLVVGHRAEAGHAHVHPDDREHAHGYAHSHTHGAGGRPEATVTAANVRALFDPDGWDVVTATEPDRHLLDKDANPVPLHDVVVRATRR